MADSKSPNTQWKKGPLPPGTWNWGGIVVGPRTRDPVSGFYFADFRGDHVLRLPDNERVEAADVLYYNNSLDLPPE